MVEPQYRPQKPHQKKKENIHCHNYLKINSHKNAVVFFFIKLIPEKREHINMKIEHFMIIISN